MIPLACFLFICSTISAKSIIVPTPLGKIRGKLVHDEITGLSHYEYTGIPYAVPPLGKLRFLPPVPIQPSRTIIDATKPAPVCPQREEYYTRAQMSEDCLFFNVFVPANITSKLLPVIFFVHGGYFDTLSGNARPLFGTELLVKNHVVVTINYRLGPLGFLSLCNEEASGNSGLKDAVLALKTVHKNIMKFGGDPNKITLLGIAAGGAMVELLMMTPETAGLFVGVWAQSGSALSATYLQLYPRENALALACELGIQYLSDADLIHKLKCVDPFEMVEAADALIKRDPQRGYRIESPFTPTVETVNKNAILTESPVQLLEKGAVQDVPRAVSVNNRAGINILSVLRNEPQRIDKFNEDHELLVPSYIQYPKGSDARKNLAARIWKLYFNANISMATVQNYINLETDVFSLFPSDYSVQKYSEKKSSPVYYNLCAVDTELNYLKAAENITYLGCAHVDEIGYEFITDVTRPKYQNLSAVATRLQTQFLDGVQGFTYNGNPSTTVAWPPAGPERYHIVIYNYATVKVYQAPYPERMAFWRSVYKEYVNSVYNTGFYCINPNARSEL